MEEFFTQVSNFGFPIVVAGYLLFRFEKKIEMFTQAIDGKEGLSAQVLQLQNSNEKLVEELRTLRRVIEKTYSK